MMLTIHLLSCVDLRDAGFFAGLSLFRRCCSWRSDLAIISGQRAWESSLTGVQYGAQAAYTVFSMLQLVANHEHQVTADRIIRNAIFVA